MASPLFLTPKLVMMACGGEVSGVAVLVGLFLLFVVCSWLQAFLVRSLDLACQKDLSERLERPICARPDRDPRKKAMEAKGKRIAES
jgi:hypothetical protein